MARDSKTMTTILACDTANGTCSVALLRDGVIVQMLEEKQVSRQAEQLLPMVEMVCAQSECTYNDLDALAVTIGPGSFTGVRIALAAMRGLRLVTKLPLISVTTLEAVAYQASIASSAIQPILVVLDARRGQVYAQHFSFDLNPMTEPQLLTYEEVKKLQPEEEVLLVGNGTRLVAPFLTLPHIYIEGEGLPTAIDVAQVAFIQWQKKSYNDSAVPLYIRLPDAKPSQ